MATASTTSADPLAVTGWTDDGAEASKSDRYLAGRLAAASADYKGVAIVTFALAVGVAGLAWLACGVILEHWFVPGGLPQAARWTWFGAGATALVAALVRWMLPLVRYRVNLVYAARALEREHPELHNDVVNAVLVKAHPDAATPLVVRSLGRRAAKRLSALPNEGVVDRTWALRLAAVLALLVAATGVYELVGPKSVAVSAVRLLAPWLGIAPPSRVRIEPPRLAWRMPAADGAGPAAVHPLDASAGAVTLVRGRQLVVSSEIRGLASGEQPRLTVVPVRDDGSIDPAAVPWEVAMTAGADPGAGGGPDTPRPLVHAAILPDATRGLQHSVDLVIAAGDARSERVRVAVVDTPALLVGEVRYDYPAYTRLPQETVRGQGDLRALEGTRVTIVAEGNCPLESAWLDFGCDGGRDVPLRIGQHDLARASGSFTLRMNADRTGPEHVAYRLAFQPRGSASAGRAEPVVEKLEHRIEVFTDLAPEVAIESPAEQVVRVPPGAPVGIGVRALDPDFALAEVALETRLQGREPQPGPELLRGPRSGVFRGVGQIVPERCGAGPGSVLEYRAVATDTRPEEPNVRRTEWRALKIDAAAPPREQPPAPPEGADGQGGGDQAGGEQAGGDQGAPGAGDAMPPADAAGRETAPDGGGRDAPDATPPGEQKPAGEDGGDAAAGGAQDRPQDAGKQGGDRQAPEQRDDGEPNARDGGEDRPGSDAGRQDGEQAGKGQRGDGPQPGDPSRAGERGQGEQQRAEPDEAMQERDDERAGAGGEQRDGQRDGQPDAGEARQPPQNSVAADGTDDGAAMDRILENRRRQEEAAQKPACADPNGEPCGKEGCESCQGGKPGAQGAGEKGAGEKGGGEPGARQQRGDAQPQGGPQADAGRGEPSDAGKGKQDGERQDGAPPSDCKGGDGKPCGKEGCATCSGGKSGQGGSGAGGQNAGQGRGDEAQQGGQQGVGDRSEQQGEPGGQPGGDAQEGAGGDARLGDGRADKPARDQAGAAPGMKDGQPGSEAGAESQPGGDQPAPGSAVGTGGRAGGDRAAAGVDAAGQRIDRELEWTDQDLDDARNAADLALAHLRDSVEAGRTDVLDELGWTPEQARAFLARWQALRQLAGSSDQRQRGEAERALRSLGLRPDGVRASRDVPADVKGGQAEGRRSRPPASYREQFRAFLQGTSAP